METPKPNYAKRSLRIARRPKVLSSTTYKLEMSCGGLFITVEKLPNKQIFGVFAKMSKTSPCIQGLIESLCKIISIAIRAGVPIEELMKRLEKTDCSQATFIPEFGKDIHRAITSCQDAIAIVLKKEWKNEE